MNGHCSLGTFDRRATTRPGIAQHSIGWIRCAARAYAWTWAASWALAARKSCWGRRNSNGSSRNRWWFPATRWGWILSLIYGYLKTKTNNVLLVYNHRQNRKTIQVDCQRALAAIVFSYTTFQDSCWGIGKYSYSSLCQLWRWLGWNVLILAKSYFWGKNIIINLLNQATEQKLKKIVLLITSAKWNGPHYV